MFNNYEVTNKISTTQQGRRRYLGLVIPGVQGLHFSFFVIQRSSEIFVKEDYIGRLNLLYYVQRKPLFVERLSLRFLSN